MELNEDGTVGGSHQVLHDTVRFMDRQRLEPVVCFYQDNPLVPRLAAMEVEVHRLDALRTEELGRRTAPRPGPVLFEAARAVRTRVGLIRSWGIDLVHLNNSPRAGFLDWLPAARLAGVPITVSAMGDAEPLTQRVRRRMAASFDHYIPVSAYMEQALLRQSVLPHRMTLVPNGVDLDRLRGEPREPPGEVRQALGVRPGQWLIVMVGNLRPWKGHHVVIDALASLDPTQRDSLVVAFAGAGDRANPGWEEALHQQVARHGLEDQVRWLGRREDVPTLFAAADLGLHASTTPEPFGLVLVECMAMGTPLIAAAEGGASEIVTEGTGWLYAGGNDRALAGVLRDVLRQPREGTAWVERRAACLARAELYDARRMAAAISAVWARVLRIPDGPSLPSLPENAAGSAGA